MFIQAAYQKGGLLSTPPPPAKPGEIEYLDLNLDDPSQEKAQRSPAMTQRATAAQGSVTPTEYHDIDFARTQALNKTRIAMETMRKSTSG